MSTAQSGKDELASWIHKYTNMHMWPDGLTAANHSEARIKTHRDSLTSFAAQDAITLQYLNLANDGC